MTEPAIGDFELEAAGHRQLRDCARQLNHLYLTTEQFHRSDCDPDGFQWLDLHNAADSVWAFARRSRGQHGGAAAICIFNATPMVGKCFWASPVSAVEFAAARRDVFVGP
ncbi:MAG: hypothetical protein ABI356_14505 [Steroidobacteraceae bacterium]